MIITIFEIIGVILLADFVTGVVHWLEDSFWSEQTPILGKWLIAPNLEHHKNGQAFLKKSWWSSSWDLILAGASIIVIAYFTHHLSWQVILFAFLIANANQIHKWAHIARDENKPKIIALLHRAYILQHPRHHGQHHRKPNNSHYCTITNVLNPVLDKINFWHFFRKTASH